MWKRLCSRLRLPGQDRQRLVRPDVEQRRDRLDALARTHRRFGRPSDLRVRRHAWRAPAALLALRSRSPRAPARSRWCGSRGAASSRAATPPSSTARAPRRAIRCSPRAATGSKIPAGGCRRAVRRPATRDKQSDASTISRKYNAGRMAREKPQLPIRDLRHCSQSSSSAPGAWHLRQARWLRADRNRQRAVAPKFGPVGREGRPPRRVGRMAGEAAVLAVAGDAGADVALGRPANGWPRAAWTAPRRSGRAPTPAGGSCLSPVPVPNGFVRPPAGEPPLGVGGDARALVAADAERLRPVARRAVGRVAARVDRVQRNVVRRVNVGRAAPRRRGSRCTRCRLWQLRQ